MAWTIEVVGENPLQAAHPVEFLGPAAYGCDNVLQIFAIADTSPFSAPRTSSFVRSTLTITCTRVDPSADGSMVYIRLWDSPKAAKMHDDAL